MDSDGSIEINSSDSDDIELVSVHVSQPTSTSGLTGEQQFIWSELSVQGSITPASLRQALHKYEVLETDEQVQDMIHLVSQRDEANLVEFTHMLGTVVKKS